MGTKRKPQILSASHGFILLELIQSSTRHNLKLRHGIERWDKKIILSQKNYFDEDSPIVAVKTSNENHTFITTIKLEVWTQRVVEEVLRKS